MCGIFATIQNTGVYNPAIVNLLPNAFQQIKHRGPDASSLTIHEFACKKTAVIGFHHLAIIGNKNSMQPIQFENCIMVCNGEIFNYAYLMKKYKFSPMTTSDCEIIVRLYVHLGRDIFALRKLLSEINGEFAFIICDLKTNFLFAVRDTFGVRPLFLAINTSLSLPIACFASEAKALQFCEKVVQLPSGAVFNFNLENNYHGLLYYNSINTDPITQKKGVILENIRNKLSNAVDIRLMSDRPIGCFLSGGIDSSLVTALVASKVHRLECFTIGLKGSPDVAAAKAVVEHIRKNNPNLYLKHHILDFTIDDGIKVLPEVVRALETYDITTIRASVPQFLLAKYINENTDVKVLFSGEGADELFASYSYFRMAPSPSELHLERCRLLRELYMFDNLRVDRTAAAFGLEVRLPFLDINFAQYVLQITPKLFMSKNTIEKKILRDAFDINILPKTVLMRRKEAFSDAVSSNEVSWYKSIQNHADNLMIIDEDISEIKNMVELPTNEARFYWSIFRMWYPAEWSTLLKYYWMPKWVDTNGDPSATILPCYYTKIE